MSHPIYVRDERFDSPCPICGKGELRIVAISYDAQKKYEGRLHRFHISNLNVKKCESCGELFFDAASHEQIAQGLRGKLKLLSPSDIRQKRYRDGFLEQTFNPARWMRLCGMCLHWPKYDNRKPMYTPMK